MGAFVITKRFDGAYKFVFTSRKGKTIFTSSKFMLKEDCESGIDLIKALIHNGVSFKFKTVNGKYVFEIIKDNHILAISRKFTTELMMKKGVDEIVSHTLKAEVLDFSNEGFVFSEF